MFRSNFIKALNIKKKKKRQSNIPKNNENKILAVIPHAMELGIFKTSWSNEHVLSVYLYPTISNQVNLPIILTPQITNHILKFNGTLMPHRNKHQILVF